MRNALIAAIALAICLGRSVTSLAQQPEQPPKGQSRADTALKESKVFRDLTYVEGGHERNRLDLYLPEKAEGRLPLIVWIHGGAWYAGSKTDPSPAMAMVGKGYAVASINYRLSQHAVFPAQIEDCKAAIRWLRANAGKYNLDPERIGVWGLSAGGHLVALLGTAGGVKQWEPRREPRSVEPRAMRRRLVRPDGIDRHGR